MEKNYKRITEQDIIRVENELDSHKVYSDDDSLVYKVIKQFPNHECTSEEIAMKIAVIDVANSTRLNMHKKSFSIYDLARRIKGIKDVDKRLKDGDETLVSEIAHLYGSPVLTSFASKYCAIHNRYVYDKDSYSKYDDLVRNALNKYVSVKKTHMIHNYELYHNKITEIIDSNNLNHIENIREKIDHFIWWDEKNK